MINHFKAEFYKLRHSKILITILGVCAAVIMVSFALGDMTFFGAGDGTESVIGFQAKCYLSSEIPTFQTVARSSLAYTAFFWIIGILFATIFFTKSFNRFLIISLDVLICRYSPLFRAFPALFISEEPHKSFYYPLCFRSQK